jgi:hypothetical protein
MRPTWRGAGEGDERNARVVGDGGANVGAARDEGDEGGREAVALEDVGNDTGDGDRGERGGRSALPEESVAADGGERLVPAVDGAGEVEGRDDADDAERIPGLENGVLRTLGRQEATGNGAAEADSVVADVDVLLHLADALGLDLADLERDQLTQIAPFGTQRVADLPHQLAAHRHRHVAKLAPAPHWRRSPL